MIVLIILILSILILSGLCSMTEAAILSLPFARARIFREEKRKGADDLLFVKEHIHTAIATVVILNNSINIIGAIFVGQKVAGLFGNQWLGITSAVFTFAIIIVAEIIPKTIGETYKTRISLSSAKILKIVMHIFRPLVSALIFMIRPLKKKKGQFRITEQEIKMMLRLGKDMGTVEVDEEALINRVFKLNDLTALQMMKPIEQIYSLPYGMTLSELKDKIINSPYSRIAVYKKDISDIVGIVQQRILLREIAKDNYGVLVDEFIAMPVFIYENEKADTLLEKFRSYHQHLFIVKSMKEANIGIITMEDCLEELFGEIYDEKDLSRRSR
ncbi:MAG: DUF21 domain-containing protein [Candidatus Omnitrophica bacterium]|nr:DUF21 domain-containing protein [Candidatus Omnitrophota bacterium]